MSGGTDLAVREIAAMLNQQAPSLAPMLLPNGRATGPYFEVGSVDGEPGDSLKIHLKGGKIGKWSDYSRTQGERGGTGDMLTLVRLSQGLPDTREGIAEAVKWAKRYLGLDGQLDPGVIARQRQRAAEARRTAEQRAASEWDGKRRDAERMWLGASELHRAPPALDYYRSRGIDFAAIGRVPRALRFRADVGCRWTPPGQSTERVCKLPAVVSAMIGPDGRHMATHATFLDRQADGRWLILKEHNPKTGRLSSCKRIFGPYVGAHIPLNKGACRKSLKDIDPGVPIEASEGIEDGLSVAMAFPALRIIAAGTLGNLERLVLPAQAGAFTVIGQHDAEGSKAAAALEKVLAVHQQRAREDGSGRAVAVRWPLPGFKDFNDQLRGIAA